MKPYLSAFAGAVLLCGAATAANATVIGFNNFPESGALFDARGSVVNEGGYTLTSSSASPLALIQWANSASIFGLPVSFDADPNDPAGHTLAVGTVGSTTTLTNAASAAFDLLSIDFADMFNTGASGTIGLTWDLLGGGTGSTSVTLDSLAGLETFAINALGVVAVHITGLSTTGGWLQMDNINVVPHEVVGTVPLPAGLPLLMAGLGGLAFLGRGRRRNKGI